MNCRNCNSRIDYNYVTNCPQCGCEVEGGNLPKLDPSIDSGTNRRLWLSRFASLWYVLTAAVVSMISGAVVLYLSAAVIYIAVQTPETRPGENCAKGMAIGMLSILLGAFLGTVAGTAFAVKHPILKRGINGPT